MRAVVIRDGVNSVETVKDPTADHDEVVVRVMAAGLNAADLQQIRGNYPAPAGWPESTPGLEVAGVVESVGRGADGWNCGDRVMALVGGGGHAQRLAIPAGMLLPIPAGLSFNHAAGFPEAFTTAWDALIEQANVRPGERVLITGAAGGVGTAMVQVAILAGADVVASARRTEAHALLRNLSPDVEPVLPEHEADAGPFDVIVELVGGDSCMDRIDYLAEYGRIVVIGVHAGHAVPIRLFDLMRRRGRVLGSTIRSRTTAQKIELAAKVRRGLLARLGRGEIQIPIDSVFPIEEAAAAYERLAQPGKFGKIVLDVGELGQGA